jgi:hypothetical protein
MGTYSKTLSKRLRKRPSVKNDPFWDHQPSFHFAKCCFNDRYSREEWCRIQTTHGITKTQANMHYDLYCSMEHWFSEDYWVILDKQCQTAIYKTFDALPKRG